MEMWYSKTILLVCAVIFTVISCKMTDSPAPVMRACLPNGKIVWFDNNTQDCTENGVVQRQTVTESILRACLRNGKLVWFDNNTQDCTENGVVQRPTVRENIVFVQDANTVINAKASESASHTRKGVKIYDKFKCGYVTQTGRSSGYVCCGYGKYHPDFETCCVQMIYNFKVHTGKMQRDHICCGMDAHPRRSTIPCQHPALNDVLWNTKLKFIKKYKAKAYCQGDKYEYLMTFGTKDEQVNFHFYHANITKLDNSGRSAGTEQVKVAIDKFSPKRTLEAKSFFIISENIYENDFYLGLNDTVMKLPRKMRKFWKRFRKVQKKCRKSANRSQRRRLRHRT